MRSRLRALFVCVEISQCALDIDNRLRERRAIEHPLLLVQHASLRKGRARNRVVERHLEGQHGGVVVKTESPQPIERIAIDSTEREPIATDVQRGWSWIRHCAVWDERRGRSKTPLTGRRSRSGSNTELRAEV